MKIISFKFKKLLIFFILLILFNLINVFYFNNNKINTNSFKQENIIKSICSCKNDIILHNISNKNLIIINEILKNNFNNEINLYNLTYDEYKLSHFTCDLYNVLKRGPKQNILSYSLNLNKINLNESLLLIKKISSLSKNLYPLWSIRIYYNDNIDNLDKLKCEYECKYNNIDFCNINKLGNYNINIWKWLPIGDTFVNSFSSRNLYNWNSILNEFNFILKWLNNKKYESHLFKSIDFFIF